MKYHFKCDQCQSVLEHDEDIAGENVQCPGCNAVVRVGPSDSQLGACPAEHTAPKVGPIVAEDQQGKSRELWVLLLVIGVVGACLGGWFAVVYSQQQAEQTSASLELLELERGVQALDLSVAEAEREVSELKRLELDEAPSQSTLRQLYIQARRSHFSKYFKWLEGYSAGHAARDSLQRATQLSLNNGRLMQAVEAGMAELEASTQVQADAQFQHYGKPLTDWVLRQSDSDRAQVTSWLRLDDAELVSSAYFELRAAQLAKSKAEAERLAQATAEAERLAQATAAAQDLAEVQAEAGRLAQATAAAQRLEQQWQVCLASAPVPLILVEAGRFQMGGFGIGADEQPVHEVRFTQCFGLGQTEVTQSQYEAIMGNNPSRFKDARLPVERVSWEEAVTYCKRLTTRERAAGRLPAGFEYTLPTEAEWEYACRADTRGGFAGELDRMGWYLENSSSSPHPVGQKQPNAWGLYDMHGNVWEWCSDGYGAYLGISVDDPSGTTNGAFRVLRGGGWRDIERNCRSALRARATPGSSGDILGFRVSLRSLK